MTDAYTLRNVTYTYGGSPVLDIGEMQIPEGEIVALVGPNGSGKNHLLHLLAFLETPQTGQIEFFGEESHEGNLLALRRKAGLLLQNPYLFHETVMSNMIWGCAEGHIRPRCRTCLFESFGTGRPCRLREPICSIVVWR